MQHDAQSTEQLQHRISRIQGQLEAIKGNLDTGGDVEACRDVLYQLKAARSALKRVGDVYIANNISACLAEESISDKQRDDIEDILQTALNS
jgi:DNA-binding FrmR family transcriptional regulator